MQTTTPVEADWVSSLYILLRLSHAKPVDSIEANILSSLDQSKDSSEKTASADPQTITKNLPSKKPDIKEVVSLIADQQDKFDDLLQRHGKIPENKSKFQECSCSLKKK